MTIDEIKRRNREAGQHFFDPDTMRFFNSRVSTRTYGRYFVTSERDPWGISQRRYTVRLSNGDGSIDTVGEFQQHASAERAHAHAKRMSERSDARV